MLSKQRSTEDLFGARMYVVGMNPGVTEHSRLASYSVEKYASTTVALVLGLV